MKRMLRVFLFFFSCVFICAVQAQNVGINTTGAQPDASAMLDVSSTDQGVLIPRMSDARRKLLKDPVAGLVIYNTTTNQLNFFNGTQWRMISVNSVSTVSVGGTGPGGGTAINTSGALAHPSAILDVADTLRGMKLPVVQLSAISNPVPGLLIFNASNNQISYYDGTAWKSPCSVLMDKTKGAGAVTRGIGINSNAAEPNPSAALDVSSDSMGVLFPRMTPAQRNAIKSPGKGLIIYNSTDKRFENWTGTAWQQWLPACPAFACGDRIVVDHIAGDICPEDVIISYKTVESYVTMGNPRCWLAQNLGAVRQADCAFDTSAEAAGWYWQFNRRQGYRNLDTNGSVNTVPTWTLTNVGDEPSDWLLANDPCALLLGSGWRLPTNAEWASVDTYGFWNSVEDGFNTDLVLHAAGNIVADGTYNPPGTLLDRGNFGTYQSSTQHSTATYPNGLNFNFEMGSSTGAFTNFNFKAAGYSVRCIMD